MAKEQMIYVGPEEELTNVRERLENSQAGRITLVIPPQTQLRSHVGWRLLRSRVRELGKDVLVISSDPQIRAVAKAAGFRVADSLESLPSNKPRPDKRTVRSDASKKAAQGSGKQPGNGPRDSRSLRSVQQPNKRNQPPNNRQQQTSLSSGNLGRNNSNSSDINTEVGAPASSMNEYEIEDLSFDSHYSAPNQAIPIPPGRSVVTGQEDDEIDPLLADYYVARSIREAAQSSENDSKPSASNISSSEISTPQQSNKFSPQGNNDDPFAYMEDVQPVPLPEQRASTYIHNLDQENPDLSDIPTDVHEIEIEDLGDEGEVMLQHDSSPHAFAEPMLEGPGNQVTPRIYRMTPRSNRTGSYARPSFEDFEGEDELLPIPIPDQPTRSTPSYRTRSTGVLDPQAADMREPKPRIQSSQQKRNVSTNYPAPKTRKPSPAKTSRTVTKPPMTGKSDAISSHRGRRMALIAGICLAVLAGALLAWLFLGANATVTIIVPTQPLSVNNVLYTASTNPPTTQQHPIPSQVLTYTASASGSGTASDTVPQGNQVASGTVTFSNKTTKPLDIPTNTVLSTSGAVAVQFVTTADALVQPDSSSTLPSVVPVQAQLAGESGNVAANTITIIPPDSLIKIAQYNTIPSTSVNLAVTNPNPMTGGGATNVASVSTADVNALAQTLQEQVQSEIRLWLSKNVSKDDVMGTLMPNVLASSTPLPGEKLVITPPVGKPAPGGKFTGVLSATVSVLVIRHAAIQAAGRAQLNATALRKNPPYALAAQLPVTVKVTNQKPSADGKTLSITIDATGSIVQQVSTQVISKQVAGMGVDQAKNFIMSGQAGIKGVVDTSIQRVPSFLGFMPFRPEQIHIIVQPGPAQGTPNG